MTAATAERADTTATTYRFGGSGTAGLWLGLGLPRLAALAGGLVITVLLLTARVALPLAMAPLAVSALVSLVPVAGRPMLGWVRPAAGHTINVGPAGHGWHGGIPWLTLGGRTNSSARLCLPAEYGRWQLHEATGEPIAFLADPAARTWTVLFAVAGVDRFPLLDPAGQERLISGWGQVLTSLGQRERELTRVQLVDWAAPGDNQVRAAAAWATARADDAQPERQDDYAALGMSLAELSVRRDAVLAVQSVVPSGIDPAQLVGVRAREFAQRLLSAQLVARPLCPADVAGVFSRLLGIPASRTCSDAGVGPVSRRTGWDHVRIDDCWHRSFHVTGWPGSPVGPGWLSPLLLSAPPVGARTLAVHLLPVSAEQGARIARAARTRAELDRADRARLGLPQSAAADQAVAESADMDAELVAGHSTHRLAALISCSADSPVALDEACRATRDAAVTAGLQLRPLHGQHHLALAGAVPLCRLAFGGAT